MKQTKIDLTKEYKYYTAKTTHEIVDIEKGQFPVKEKT